VATPPSDRIVITFNNGAALREQMLRFEVATPRSTGTSVFNDVRTTVTVGSVRNAVTDSLAEQINRAHLAGYIAGTLAEQSNGERNARHEAAAASPRSLAASIIRGSRSPTGGS